MKGFVVYFLKLQEFWLLFTRRRREVFSRVFGVTNKGTAVREAAVFAASVHKAFGEGLLLYFRSFIEEVRTWNFQK